MGDIGLVKNIKWRDFEKKFVQKEMKKKFEGKDSIKWQKISCALAVFTKNKMGNDKSLGSAPWRSTRAVREKCNLLAAASKATASTSKKKKKKKKTAPITPTKPKNARIIISKSKRR